MDSTLDKPMFLQSVLPGLITIGNYVRAVRYPDSAIINGTGAAESGYTTSAAVGPGDIISLYGTGLGLTSSNQPDGAVFAGAYPTTNTVTVSIGETPAQVLWAGLIGAGLYQINVVVPSTLGDSDQPIVATVAGVSSQSSARLKVAASAKLSTQALFRGRTRQSIPPSPYAKASLQRLDWLGGLIGHPQHSAGPSPLSRAAMQAAEAQGGIVQLA